MKLRPVVLVTGLALLFSSLAMNAQELLLENYYSGNYREVIAATSDSLNHGDIAPIIFHLKILSEISLGQTAEAIQTLQKALQTYPEDPRFRRMIAGQYFESGNFLKARIAYMGLVSEDSTDVSSWLKLAEIASFRQNYDEAVSALNQVLAIDSMNLGSLMKLGDILDRHNHTGAVIYYERAYRYYPESQKAAYALANKYIKIKKSREAIPICDSMLSLDSTSIKFRKLLGYAHYKTADPYTAIRHFKLANSLGDSSAFTMKFLGICQYLATDFDGAVESLDMAARRDSLDAEVHFFLGASLATTQAKKDATYHLERSLELMQPDPSIVARIYSELGNIKRLETEYEEGLALYTMAWKTDTTNPMYLYYMASILDNSMHRSKDALEIYQQYVDAVEKKASNESHNRQQISIYTIVLDRIESLKEELFFRDED